MYDYSSQLEEFRREKVTLGATLAKKLRDHRKANRDRLIQRLPKKVPQAKIGSSNFRPQGSMAIGTTIRTKFVDEEYDIDDGLIVPKSRLLDEEGEALTAKGTLDVVREVLKDKRFKKQPRLCTNCVRVFYAEEGDEKHHVDIPIYRTWINDDDETVQELASQTGWVESDPKQVTVWFESLVQEKNAEESGSGTQLRRLVQLFKRFSRSRLDWLELLPNGMKLTMLVAECQPAYEARIDVAFRSLLEKVSARLVSDKVVRNLAHPDKPAITRGQRDENIVALQEKVDDAIEQLDSLDEEDNDSVEAARRVWDWVFKSDGFFKELADSERATFVVSWRKPTPWTETNESDVVVTGKWSASGSDGSWNRFDNDGPALPKHVNLRFQADTSAAKPFSVYWQVVNTGEEAILDGGQRGDILPSKSAGAGGLKTSRRESTKYSGTHWIECFIVRDGNCVARSGPFVVNIQ